ncbi:MAG: DNA ligase, partial [Nitrososphaerales archaeon]
CKHLRQVNGAAFEAARLVGGTSAPASAAVTKAPVPARAVLAPTGTGAPDSSDESPDEVLAAIFGKKGAADIAATSVPKPTVRIEVSTTAEGAEKLRALTEVAGMKVISVEPADPEADYKQSLIDRAAAEGRSLRQDEKAKINGPPLLLAQKYDDFEDLDPTGWHCSEKLDGVRGYWNGKDFISRQGNIFFAPAWFKAGLPDHPLDGELWMGRQKFQQTLSIVRSQDSGERWKDVKYVVFDMPKHGGEFEDRIAALHALKTGATIPYMEVHSHSLVTSHKDLIAELKRVVALGAEGLMLRKPGSLYEARRSATLLKLKLFQDAEAMVVGYEKSTKGQFKGLVGSLVMRMLSNGKPTPLQFNLNAKTVDLRTKPPAVGSIVTYSYTELTDEGRPKCASFVAVRDYE